MRKNYRFAEHVFSIEALYGKNYERFRGYETDEPAEFSIRTKPEDIEYEKRRYMRECVVEKIPAGSPKDSDFELTSLNRKAAEALLPYDILLYHGSVVERNGNAYMFIAKSGTGKSTHSRMWRECFGQEAVMVNDDKPLIRITEEKTIAYGTPWNGKHRLGNNIAVPLAGICILRRGEENSIRELSFAEAYPMLLQQVYRIPDRECLGRILSLIDRMGKNVRFYEMHCTISHEAAEMAYRTMSGEQELK